MHSVAAVHATRLKARLERLLERTRRQDGVHRGRRRLAATERALALAVALVNRAAALVAARALGLGTTNLALLAGLARLALAGLEDLSIDLATLDGNFGSLHLFRCRRPKP